MKIIRTVLSIVAAMVFVIFSTLAQEVNPKLSEGSKALLFSWNGFSFLNAGAFNGGIGARYYLLDKLAIVGGLQFGTASMTNPANPGVGQTGADGSQSATSIGVSGAAEIRMGSGRVRPFVGAGVGFSFTRTESKNTVNNVTPANPQVTTKNNVNGENISGVTYVPGTAFDVFGLAGFEFFLYDELSLSAQYQAGFTTTSFPDQEQSAANVTVTTKGGSSSSIGITTSGALTLAVYF